MRTIALVLVVAILAAYVPGALADTPKQVEFPSLYWEVKLMVDQVKNPSVRAALMEELNTFNRYMSMSAQAPSTASAIAYVALGVKVLFRVAAGAKAMNGATNPGAMLAGLSPRFVYCRTYNYGGCVWVYCPDDKWNYTLQLACDSRFRCYPFGISG